jgi:hypothetical protein
MAAATLTFPSQTLLKNVVVPVDGTDAATKEYVDGRTGAGSVAAAGTNTHIQFNDAGSIGASAKLTFNKSGNILTITGNLVSSNANLGNLATANYVNIANNLSVAGDANITGNLTVLGTVSYIESTTTYVTDPLYEIGGGSQGATLSTDDNKDRGTILHYFDTTPIDAFMGWDNSNAEFAIASNVSVTDNIVTYNNFGNIRVGNIFAGNLVNANFYTGDGGLLSNVIASSGTSTTVSASAQPNITSLGSLVDLTVGQGLSNVYIDGAGNITVGNKITTTQLTVTGNSMLQGNTEFQQIVTLTSSADSINSSTGALILTLGGLGVYGNIHSGMGVTGVTLTGNITTASQPNITSLGNLVSLIVGNSTANSTFGNGTITLTSAGNITGGNLVSANYFTGTLTTASQPNITSVGMLTNTTLGASNSLSGGNLVSANYFTGTLTTNVQPNITSLGTLVNVTVSGTSDLGNIGNVRITGGSSGQYLKTDGTGNLNWDTVDTSRLANGTTEIQLLEDGNINFTAGTQGGYQGNYNFFDGNIQVNNSVNANTLAASNTITRNGRTVATYVSSTTMPTDPQEGDKWYDLTLDKVYQYVYDGSVSNWIDVSSGYISANVQAQVGTLVLRDGNANVYANTIHANALSVTGTAKIGSIVSAGNGQSVSNSTETMIDTFPKTLYRSAKYIISARNDDGFEVAEMLLIHDNMISFIQTYGDVSTGTVQDIVTFSSNIVSGNVCLYATGSNSNTFVNLVSTYVTD